MPCRAPCATCLPATCLPACHALCIVLTQQPGCGAGLRDHILDWEDALPEDELELSGEAHNELHRWCKAGCCHWLCSRVPAGWGSSLKLTVSLLLIGSVGMSNAGSWASLIADRKPCAEQQPPSLPSQSGTPRRPTWPSAWARAFRSRRVGLDLLPVPSAACVTWEYAWRSSRRCVHGLPQPAPANPSL